MGGVGEITASGGSGARRTSGCGVPGATGCVDETSASLLRDGILPGFGAASYGLDARHQRPFQRPSETVFRTAVRSSS